MQKHGRARQPKQQTASCRNTPALHTDEFITAYPLFYSPRPTPIAFSACSSKVAGAEEPPPGRLTKALCLPCASTVRVPWSESVSRSCEEGP
jgi:hypothetical protein